MYELLYLGLAAFTESQIFLENLMYGIKGFSGAFGGLGTPFPLFEFRGPALWGLKLGLLYWPCLKGFDLNSQSKYNREHLKALTSENQSKHKEAFSTLVESLVQMTCIDFTNFLKLTRLLC